MDRHPSLDERFDPAIRVVDHDPASPALAAAEQKRIGAALDDVAVRLEHVGSTAVPGLAAKPILDLQLSVAQPEPPDRYVGRSRRSAICTSQTRVARLPPLRQAAGASANAPLHVCRTGSEHERRHVAVRDCPARAQ
jgi:GrpB-like predicted nucleotidyltransferase (UPF0157 family)